MGRPLSSAFRAIREGRHPVKGNGDIIGARPIPGFLAYNAEEQGEPGSLQAPEDPFEEHMGDPECEEVGGFAVPQHHLDPGSEDFDPFGDFIDSEEFDYDPLGLGFSLA